MRRLRPTLTVPAGEIRFDEIDDFHPDRLYTRLALFKALREKRATPPGADEDVNRLLGKASAPTATTPVGDGAPAAARGLDALIREAIAPHIVKDTSAQAQAHVAAVDSAIAEQMRRLDALYPRYGFSSHVGYITPEHTRAVLAHGPCPQHRRSFQARAYLETVAA